MSIVEVAKKAGVSHSTVSRVINGHPAISKATAEIVRHAMDELGYRPQHPRMRRGPRNQLGKGVRTGNIAVVWFGEASRLAATHFVRTLQSIGNAINEHGFSMLVSCIYEGGPVPEEIVKDNVDGFIIIFGEPTRLLAAKLEKMPTVWISSRLSKNGDRVISGNEAVGQLAAKYLLGRGHRHIAFLNSIPEHPALRARGEGFKFEAYRAGIETEMLVEEHNRFSTVNPQTLSELDAGIEPLIARLKTLQPRPTGLFIPQDKITARVYRFLNRAGICPGKDITIVSADHEEAYLAGLDPIPATIDIGSEINAKHAVEQLLWRMRHPEEKRTVQITIEPVLIEAEQVWSRG